LFVYYINKSNFLKTSDATENELIATFFNRWSVLEKLEMQQTGIHWVNMYGAPEYKDKAGILDNIKKAANRVGHSVSKMAMVTRHHP
jgi:hypothetical protein